MGDSFLFGVTSFLRETVLLFGLACHCPAVLVCQATDPFAAMQDAIAQPWSLNFRGLNTSLAIHPLGYSFLAHDREI